jgi:hypothetical protein
MGTFSCTFNVDFSHNPTSDRANVSEGFRYLQIQHLLLCLSLPERELCDAP